MKLSIIVTTMLAITLALGCSSEDKDAAADAAADLKNSATDTMKHAQDSAGAMADDAKHMAKEAAGTVAGNAVAACRNFAESGSWEQALDVCAKAHEMMPDDMALEHAYQQAKAANSH